MSLNLKKINWKVLLLFVVAVWAAGNVGSFFTFTSLGSWYQELVKPSFNPPNWIFGPVWTLLFTLMGVSVYLVWERGWKKAEVRMAMALFWAHMLFNVIWSYLFFGQQNLEAAFAEILILWGMIVWVIMAFYRVRRCSAYLLMPYLVWVTFAAILNYNIWQLNL